MNELKRWWGRSLVSGLILLVLQAVAVLAEVWGTPAFGGVLRAQVAAIALGIAELIRRQVSDPVERLPKPPEPPEPGPGT